ncbi:hypothetical protein VQ042_19265 [Aurantimonas sp. A2-1-M11]|uniref:DUF6894 family protein n=1 Tax=Aurantimonas sp. A2-1-M11 TaxID=3113712 RepID=UPI002F95D8A6
MPRYFFDIHDHERFSEDDTGIECGTLDAVRNTAVEALPDIAKSVSPACDHHTITVTARCETGENVFRATMKMDAVWLGKV